MYLTGDFIGSAAFGPYVLSSLGFDDIFAAKLDSVGNWLWAVSAGGTSADFGVGIAVDGADTAWLTGMFRQTAHFGLYTLNSNGQYDIYIAKLGPVTPVQDEVNPPAFSFTLSASPNPFAVSTAITVKGDKLEGLSGHASIDIYDLRGRKVRSLALDSTFPDGFTLNWDGRDERGFSCPNGIYLAKIELGGKSATLKLSLIK